MSVIRSPYKETERRKKLIIFSAVFGVLAVVALGVLVWLALASQFQIQDVVVRNSAMLPSDDVKNMAKEDLSGKFFSLFPKTSIFFYPEADIRDRISKTFPKWKSVSLVVDDKRTLIISLVERAPAALWCGVSVPETGLDDSCYYIDGNGFVYGKAPTFSGYAYFKFYGKGSVNADDPVGSSFVSPELFQKSLSLHDLLAKYDKKLASVSLNDDGTLTFVGAEGCKIMFDTYGSLDSLEPNIEAVFSSSEWGNGIASDGAANACSKLNYIDFRFGNKIYYQQKGKGGQSSQTVLPPPSHATSTDLGNTATSTAEATLDTLRA